MTSVTIRAFLNEEDLTRLKREFPSCEFILFQPDRIIPEEIWAKTDIFFGDQLNLEELTLARHLRWIHTLGAHTDGLCQEVLNRESHWLVTTTLSDEPDRVGRFVMGAVLAFSEHLITWYEATRNENTFDIASHVPPGTSQYTATFLQVGLGWLGSTVAKHAVAQEFRVWGVKETASFHPFCQKVFAYQNLPSLLPAADLICLCPRTLKELHSWLSRTNLELIEDDKILIILGGTLSLSEADLAPLFSYTKFRGILIDAHFSDPPNAGSPIWRIENLILSPNITSTPSLPSAAAVRLFRKNLTQFLHNAFRSMHHLVSVNVSF